jgi:preprotein translocase subunit SecE
MSIVEGVKNYFVGSYQEMKKVTWPTKNQTINYSALVIGLSVGMAIFFGLLDYIFNWGITELFLK